MHLIDWIIGPLLPHLSVGDMLKSLSLNMSSSKYTAIVSLIKQYNEVCDKMIENGLIVKKERQI